MTTTRRDVAGVCRFCGCSEFDPCPFGCGWADRGRHVCTECAPASKAEGHALKVLRKVLPMLAPWRTAFHRGFIVGWFNVSPRSPYGRNPFQPRDRREAWQIGRNHGAEARRVYIQVFGPILNRPRRSVLIGGSHEVPTPRRARHRARRRRDPGVVAAPTTARVSARSRARRA